MTEPVAKKEIDGVIYPEDWVVEQCPWAYGISCRRGRGRCSVRHVPLTLRQMEAERCPQGEKVEP